MQDGPHIGRVAGQLWIALATSWCNSKSEDGTKSDFKKPSKYTFGMLWIPRSWCGCLQQINFHNKAEILQTVMIIPEACLLMVLEHTSYVPSGTTKAFITGSSVEFGFQSSQDVSKSSANRRQKSEIIICNCVWLDGLPRVHSKAYWWSKFIYIVFCLLALYQFLARLG